MVDLRGIALAIVSMEAIHSLEQIELGAPAEVDRSRQRLQGLNLNHMCQLTPECASGVLEPLETVKRPGFFESCQARDRYCGAPGGFLDWVRVSGDAKSRGLPHSRDSARGTARDVLYRNGTWETPWTELRHLAEPSTCLAGVAGTSLKKPNNAEEGKDSDAEITRRVRRGHKRGFYASAEGRTSIKWSGANQASHQQGSGHSSDSRQCSLSLDVPLVELRDVLLGGQFVPFTRDGRSFVPLATAQERGGLAQSSNDNHSSSTGSTSTDESSAPASCCFPIDTWATDERGALAREREALLWAQPQHLAKAPVLVLDRAVVAHGGGWGDYQGGSGDNYFHTIQALASVAYLLPRLREDPGLVLLMRTCKEPWFKLKQKFAPWKTVANANTHGSSSNSDRGSSSSTGSSRSISSANGGLSALRGFTCGVEAYTKSLLEALGIPMRQVVHYPYDEHDPTFSSLAYRSDRKVFSAISPIVQLRRAIMQPPHVQHDAQLSELRSLFAHSPLYRHLPFNTSTIVVVSRNGLVPSGRCKRCVPNLAELLVKLRAHFAATKKAYPVVEVHGDEPYSDQVAAFRQAAVVLAPHGAALTSMLHLSPGAAVFELLHSRNENRQWFMVMAAKLGLRYWAVPSHEPPLNEQLEASRKLMSRSRRFLTSSRGSGGSNSGDGSSSLGDSTMTDDGVSSKRRRRRNRTSSNSDVQDDDAPEKLEVAKEIMPGDEDAFARRGKAKAKAKKGWRSIRTSRGKDVPISGGASFHTGLVTVNSAYEGIDSDSLVDALEDALDL